MRHLITLAAVAALAACSVDVEGAACLDDANCPAGQRCGHDGTCSEAAAACPGPICQQHECSGQALRTCVPDAQGVCATFSDSTCSTHQTCNATTGACDCASGGCTTGVDSFCAPGGELVTCATEAATDCRFEASSSPCALGETCGGAPTATCSCPAIGACTTAGDRSCNGDKLLECVPVEVGSLCNVWVEIEDCARSQLSCSPGNPAACTCPSPSQSPVVLHADPGAQTRPGLVRTGVLDPSICRYKTMSEALAAASSGATVKAVGFAGTPVVFTEGPLTIPAGVTVTTDDATPTPANYVVEVGGAGVQGVLLEAGASLAGVTLRRGTGGPALGVRIVGASPAGGSSLTAVDVDGLGLGGPFATGVRVEGAGAVTLTKAAVRGTTTSGLEVARATIDDQVTVTDLLVDGEATAAAAALGVGLTTGDLTLRRPVVKRSAGAGVVASGSGVTARLTIEAGELHDNFGTGLAAQLLGRFSVSDTKICRNKGGTARNINGTSRLVGGVFLAGAAPAEQAITGNRFFDNDGDQLAIGLGTGTWHLAGPSAAGAICGAGVNAFAGYGPGEYGLVVAANVDASFDAWPGGAPSIGTDVLTISTPTGPPTVLLGTEGGASDYCSLPTGLTCPAP